MPLRIRRGRRARADQVAIWLYIAAQSQAAADRQTDRFHEALIMLSNYPDSGRVRLDFDASLRMFPIDNYVIFYSSLPGILDVARILHAARDITPEMLSD